MLERFAGHDGGAPQLVTVPSPRKAAIKYLPAASETILVMLAGGTLVPTDATVRLVRSAPSGNAFAEIATTLVIPAVETGEDPQLVTVPSLLSAAAKESPAAIAMTLDRPAGTFVGPKLWP